MKHIREINLELGRPTADEALRRLKGELWAAKTMRACIENHPRLRFLR